MWVFPLLALVETLLLIHNVLVLPAPVNLIMASAQAVLVVAAVGGWLWLRSRPLSLEMTGPVILTVLLLLAGLILLEQALTHKGLLSANLALLLAVGGALITPRRRFALYCLLLVTGWLIVMVTHEQWDIPVGQQALLVAIGLLIAWVVNVLRDIDRRQLEAARDDAVRTAMRDPLTMLWNRRGVHAVLPSMIGGALSMNSGIWCVFIDVRGLKAVNDTLGHAAGDDLLAAMGAVLIDQEARGRVPARWGGDEFCLFGIGPVPDPQILANELGEQIRFRTRVPVEWGLSCGVAYELISSAQGVEGLVARADQDMYRRRGEDVG